MFANLPKPAPATARFHFGVRTYPAMITRVCEPRGPSRKARSQLEHDGGMPVRRFVAGKSPALTWWTNANFTRPSTVSIGKGAVMSPVGGGTQRCFRSWKALLFIGFLASGRSVEENPFRSARLPKAVCSPGDLWQLSPIAVAISNLSSGLPTGRTTPLFSE